MKYLIKFILWVIFILWIWTQAYAWVTGFESEWTNIQNHSLTPASSTTTGIAVINEIWMSALSIVKYIFMWVFLIFIVYTGVQMAMSMGTDDDALSKSKRQIRYAMIGLLFINIPWTLYKAFNKDNYGTVDWPIGNFEKTPVKTDSNLFIDMYSFSGTLDEKVVWFLFVIISILALVVIVLAAIKIMTSAGNEDAVKEGKSKILWSIVALLSVGFIEAWKQFAFSGKIKQWESIFESAANLALFFAGPVAIIFLTMAWYYYITSAGDEEKVKKAKNILTNTVIATVILLASYTFLLDLANL